MRQRRRRPAVLLAVALAVVACGGDSGRSDASPVPSTTVAPSTVQPSTSAPAMTSAPIPTSTSASPGNGDGDGDGISADEAHELGVATADHDAFLAGPRPAVGGRQMYELRNVGRLADSYTLRIDPATAGSADPAALPLAPGDAATFVVRWHSPARLDVVSTGRGTPIASVDLTAP